MSLPSLNAPRIGDMVHYSPMVSEAPGCRAAVVTGIHIDLHLASLMVLHTTGVQFVLEVREGSNDFFVESFEPGTWHPADHE